MSRSTKPVETTREWITGLVVIAATIVGLFSFAKISLWTVVLVSGAVLVGLLGLSWFIGAKRRRLRERDGR